MWWAWAVYPWHLWASSKWDLHLQLWWRVVWYRVQCSRYDSLSWLQNRNNVVSSAIHSFFCIAMCGKYIIFLLKRVSLNNMSKLQVWRSHRIYRHKHSTHSGVLQGATVMGPAFMAGARKNPMALIVATAMMDGVVQSAVCQVGRKLEQCLGNSFLRG